VRSRGRPGARLPAPRAQPLLARTCSACQPSERLSTHEQQLLQRAARAGARARRARRGRPSSRTPKRASRARTTSPSPGTTACCRRRAAGDRGKINRCVSYALILRWRIFLAAHGARSHSSRRATAHELTRMAPHHLRLPAAHVGKAAAEGVRGSPVGRRRGRTRSTGTPPSPTSQCAPAPAVSRAPRAAFPLHACPWTAAHRVGAQAHAHRNASACPQRASPVIVLSSS